MADVRSFKGLRYDLERLGGVQTLAQLITPPYDVINLDKRMALVATNPYNAVRLELPEGEDRYHEAARLLHEWVGAGVLVQDGRPALYIYDEEISGPGGTKVKSRALFAAVRLYDWAENVIMPHESTMTGPKADRLALLQATRANLSPIFSVYDDADGSISRAISHGYIAYRQGMNSPGNVDVAPNTRTVSTVQPGFAFVDPAGNHCLLTPIDAPEVIAAISAAFSGKRLYIADGHHRYEAALNYRNEQRAKNKGRDADEASDFVLMALTAINDPGIQVLPTHRVITELSTDDRATLNAQLVERFAIAHYPQGDKPAQTISRLMVEHQDEGHIFGAYGLEPGSVSLLRLIDPDAMTSKDDHSAAWRELDVAILEKVILQDVLGMTEHTLTAGQGVAYLKDNEEAIAMVDAGTAQLAFFLLPTPVSAMLDIADAHDRMPRKSTYFIPKLPTGVVLRRLDQ